MLSISSAVVYKGADPKCEDKDGYPMLHVAVLNGHADAIPVLVGEGAEVNRKGPK
jgi:ankyrin repeat protein